MLEDGGLNGFEAGRADGMEVGQRTLAEGFAAVEVVDLAVLDAVGGDAVGFN